MATQFQVRCLALAVFVLLILHLLLFGVAYRQSVEIARVKRDHDYLRRSVGYDQALNSVYFKPLITGGKPLWKYHEAVEVVGNEWFPANWQD